MVYVVERYLPGLCRADLLRGLSRLEPAIEDLRGEGSMVRYRGSMIVLEDEACFCRFDGPSEAAVAEANCAARLPFDRIVPAVLVQPNHRSDEMSVSTPIPKTVRFGRSHPLLAILAIAAVIALAAWGIATYAVEPATSPARGGAPTETSVLRSLTPQDRAYVLGILSLSPAQLRAAFGTGMNSVPGARGGSAPRSTATTSPPVASPILPACGPSTCWRASTSAGRPTRPGR